MLKKYKNLESMSKYFFKQKKLILALGTSMLVASSLGLTLPYFESKRLIGVTESLPSMVIKSSIILMILILFHHIFWYLWEKLGTTLTNRIAHDIRNDMIKKMIATKYIDINKNTSGYYLERITDDVTEVSQSFYLIMSVTADCITNFSFLIFMYIISWQCALMFTLGIVFMYLINRIKIYKDLKFTKQLKVLREKYSSKINEDYKGIKDIKGLGIKNIILEDAYNLSKEIAMLDIKKDYTFAFFSRITTFSQRLLTCLIIIFAICFLVPHNIITVVSLLTIINYSGFMYDLVEWLSKYKNFFVSGEFKAERINEILQNENLETFGNIDNVIDYNISVRNLNFKFEDSDKNVLNNINFELPQNSLSVFIGNSGGGKSTLFNIICKLIDTERNHIFIGNTDINDFTESTLRNNICIINQENFLINDSILNNIKIAKPDATLEEVYKVCKMANIYNEIMNLPNGFDTIIRENGSNLSGGQRQRLSIARSLLKDAKIYLFDEPTSGLDKRNQELFFKTIENLKECKTILVIAHKLTNYNIFDNVFRIKNCKLYRIKGD